MKHAALKTALLFLFLGLFSSTMEAQTKTYEQEWKKIDQFSEKGLPKSALEEVKKLYARAKAEKQDAQVVKTLYYMSVYQSETRENNETFSIAEIEKEILTAKEPARSLLQSMASTFYWNYLQQNRWKFYNRTQTVDFVKDDIATWTLTDLHKKITSLFLASIQNEKILQQTSLAGWDAIIMKGNVRHLRPTLYDLLANHALSYFNNDERDITKASYSFEIDQAEAFAPAAQFINQKYNTRDSLSLQHKALKIYQALLRFHLNDAKPDALIDADLARLAFVFDKSTHADKNKLYYAAVKTIADKYGSLPAAAQAWYVVATIHNQQAGEYKPYGDSSYRLDKVKARDILQTILKQKDSSEGKINAYNLLNELNRKTFSFTLEQVNIPGEPFRMMIEYRNVSQLSFRIIKSDEKLKTLLEEGQSDKYWSILMSAPAFKNWSQPLPAVNDLLDHKVEVKVEGLPVGEYILLASHDGNFNAKSILGARAFYVSNISYVKNNRDMMVLHRNTGQPLSGASVDVYQQEYDYKISRYKSKKLKTYKADANGHVLLDKTATTNTYAYGYYRYDISYEKDRLFMTEISYDYNYYDPSQTDKNVTDVYFFTDRAIYRPGQTLYFKGIAIRTETNRKAAAPATGRKLTVYLVNANGEEADSVTLTTNDYGSINGTFRIPGSGLTGNFRIKATIDGRESDRDFSVEEYKRPKFYTEFEPVKGSYQVNDMIKITGVAKAYAGNNIDGASVKYKVERRPRFLYPWLFKRWYQPPTSSMVITQGEVKTDKDGKFTIEFKAIPDLSIDKKFDPVFDYAVTADVTDINGETRSGDATVSVSYKALLISATIPSVIETDSLKNLSIRTLNMNGEHVPATVKVTITRIEGEQRLIRPRLWERPDQFIMSKAEYIRNFPNDEYDNETDMSTWTKKEVAYSKTDSSRTMGEWTLNLPSRLRAGQYLVEIETKDKNGQPVKELQYMEVTDATAPVPSYDYLSNVANKTVAEPGEKAMVTIGSGASNVFLVITKDEENTDGTSNTTFSYTSLDKQKKVFDYSITEKDRGGFGAGFMFIKHNRVFQVTHTIQVPWSNKQLEITYASFRDKTLPGSEEKWKVKITGKNKDRVAAEMLATMYDASLDQFVYHDWYTPNVWRNYSSYKTWNSENNFNAVNSVEKYPAVEEYKSLVKEYDRLVFAVGYDSRFLVGLTNKVAGLKVAREKSDKDEAPAPAGSYLWANGGAVEQKDSAVVATNTSNKPLTNDPVQVRKNFAETAFFYPALYTDADGSIEFSFTIPEALTRWKFLAIAHTKDLSFGQSMKEVVTQKDLMVQPNAPRFLREGDKMEFSAKVVNLTDKEMTGTAEFQLFDPATNENVDGRFKNMIPNQYFTVGAGASEALRFPIEVPYQYDRALQWRIVVKSGNNSDGEENVLAVLTNRMLVTETIPLSVRGAGTKTFTFPKLLESGNSNTLQHQSLTVEYTSNPAWFAVQSLPYLMEYPYECAEQTWNRFYANALATHIANSTPKIKQVFEQWKNLDTAALMSKLQKNEELKSVLLAETPWVLEAKTEAQQKKNLALLFDMVRMSEQMDASLEKLKTMQSSNGGFVWFTGGPDDRYITQYIVTGIGHLIKLGALSANQQEKVAEMLDNAIAYLDKKIKVDYDNIAKVSKNLDGNNLGSLQVQYLYMRSFFRQTPVDKSAQKAFDYFLAQAKKYWLSQSKYLQGMLALALHRNGDAVTATAITKSLKEKSITSDEMGMYWKDQPSGWWWYQAPVETQALMIEVFQEVAKDETSVDDLKTWLLKNKQTTNWRTTKATAEACYALLLQGSKWLAVTPTVDIKLGNYTVSSQTSKQEAGTGYIKEVIEGPKVRPQMGNISVTVSAGANEKVPSSWGGVYWQYFEDIDKITKAATPLQLTKKLFIEKNTDRGAVLTPVNDGTTIKVGDKIKVRVELRVDRDMEYVHMKDMRASSLEPVNVLSGYRYQGGLGYYESTRDASTNFFFSYLRKGTYVFEYSLFAGQAGNFSNGITTIQCMYAPEFTSHSEGIRINVE